MKMRERAHRRLSHSHARAVGVALFIAACGGTVGKVPMIGSESHFLAYCQTACDAGLECIGGICTRSCLTDSSSCSDLGYGAQCTNQSVEPGQVAVCDVSCTVNPDCEPFGTGYTCEAGYCRSNAILEQPVSAGSGGRGGSAGSGGSDTAGSAADSAMCEAFRDQSPPPDVRELLIVNRGSVPLYVLPLVTECVTSYVEVERDGQAVNAMRGGDCGTSCQQVFDEGWPSGPVALCPDILCRFPEPVLLEPGQTLVQRAGLEVIAHALPRSCVEGVSSETLECFSRAIPPPGNYTLTVRALLSPDCEHPRGICACMPLPGATGCNNPYLTPLEFPIRTPWYFESQELSIAAP
jgi:hypothetical protein